MCDTIIDGLTNLKNEIQVAGDALLRLARQLERLPPERRTGQMLNDIESQLQNPYIGPPHRAQIAQALRNLRTTQDEWLRDLIEDEQASPQRIVELNLEMGKGKLTDGEDGKGASISMFIKGPNGKGAFVFKPNLGEALAGEGWEQGGGAAREVMVCALSKELGRITGLDFGVGETSLVKIRHPSLDEVIDPPGETSGT